MESGSRNKRVSKSTGVRSSKTPSEPKYVRLQSLYGGKLIYPGPISKTKYEFNKSGAVVEVLEEDANIMLSRMRGGCCGGSPSPYFVKVV